MRSTEDFDEFVRGRSASLMRSAYLLTGDRHAAEDLVQEVLMRMYARWRSIRKAPDAYARRALVHRAINRWRSRSRRPETALLDRDEATGRDEMAGVTARRDVVLALRALPPRQRAVVVLRYLDDLSEAETAAVLGCGVGTVKSQASRGLARLREALTDDEAPQPALQREQIR